MFGFCSCKIYLLKGAHWEVTLLHSVIWGPELTKSALYIVWLLRSPRCVSRSRKAQENREASIGWGLKCWHTSLPPYSIGRNLVLWPHLITRSSGKCCLAKCITRKRQHGFGEVTCLCMPQSACFHSNSKHRIYSEKCICLFLSLITTNKSIFVSFSHPPSTSKPQSTNTGSLWASSMRQKCFALNTQGMKIYL